MQYGRCDRSAHESFRSVRWKEKIFYFQRGVRHFGLAILKSGSEKNKSRQTQPIFERAWRLVFSEILAYAYSFTSDSED